MKRILILAHQLLGDFVIFLPTLICIRKLYPDSIIDIIVATETEREIAKNSVEVNNIYIINPTKASPRDYLKLAFSIRKNKYDLGIAAAGITATKGASFLKTCGCRATVGAESKRGFKYSYTIPELSNCNEVEHNLEIIKVLDSKMNINSLVSLPIIKVSSEVENKMKLLLDFDKYKVGICVGTGDFTYKEGRKLYSYNCKQWGLNNYLELSRELSKKGCQIILFGGKKEKNAIEAENLTNDFDVLCLNLIDKCSIMESIAVLKYCDVVVGGDTGLMHCASAVGTETVSLFMATNPLVARPYYNNTVLTANVKCQPCIETYRVEGKNKAASCTDRKCIRLLSTETVYQTIFSMKES